MENSTTNMFSSTQSCSSNNPRVVLQTDDNNHNNSIWELNSSTSPSRFSCSWTNNHNSIHHFSPTEPRQVTLPHHQLVLPHPHHHNAYYKQASVYTDPHLVCLRLGKRHYLEDNNFAGPLESRVSNMGGKKGRGKPFCGAAAAAAPPQATTVPRCQVEGCHVALVNAKDYHKRHKVCEMHSKAPKVIVLGLEQRFCQQCSRFHVVSEFDDSKRSCRRRLAGHNERRRKSSHDSNSKNPSQGGALSLLSSKSDSWASPSDLSLRSSAALRELIAENRAAILARQLVRDREWQSHHQWPLEDHNEGQMGSSSLVSQQHQMAPQPNSWDKFNDNGTHVTLDLMQAPSSAFGLLTTRARSKEDDQGCSTVWNCFNGAHVL